MHKVTVVALICRQSVSRIASSCMAVSYIAIPCHAVAGISARYIAIKVGIRSHYSVILAYNYSNAEAESREL